MVANLDQVIPVMAAARPTPKWNLLDRYLVSAASLDLQAVVCITKLDLAENNPDLLEAVEEYRASATRWCSPALQPAPGWTNCGCTWRAGFRFSWANRAWAKPAC